MYREKSNICFNTGFMGGMDKYKHIATAAQSIFSSRIKIITRGFNKLIIATRPIQTQREGRSGFSPPPPRPGTGLVGGDSTSRLCRGG